MRALRMLTMAGLLGMAAPTSGGLLDMAADMPRAQAKEVKRPQVGSKEYERDMMELQKLKGDAQYGVANPDFLAKYLEIQKKYGLDKEGVILKDNDALRAWAERSRRSAPEK